MKSYFYISAIYTSPPNSMGGNTNIMLQFINVNIDKYTFIVFTTEPLTFRKNIKEFIKITVIDIRFPYQKMSVLDHFQQIQYVMRRYKDYFKNHPITEQDYFYSCSDFAPDVIPVAQLKKRYKFKWIATIYLFIPNPWENIIKKYGFPFIKYFIYYLYQSFLFRRYMLKYASFFFITNDLDKKYFPDQWHKRIFAIYGGVNIEQIPDSGPKKYEYDAVFCGRIHPQKGILRLLHIWSNVVKEIPTAKLAIIGNSDDDYDKYIATQIVKMKLNENITMLGYLNGIEKYKVYQRSKMLLHTSVYDNNGMVAAEALCAGVPVIMFDHEYLKKVYDVGCKKVRNEQEYVNTVLNAMKSNTDIKSKIENNRIKIRSYWDWGGRMNELDDKLLKYN